MNTPVRIHKSHQAEAEVEFGSAGHQQHPTPISTSGKPREISRNKISVPKGKEYRHSEAVIPTAYDTSDIVNIQFASASESPYNAKGPAVSVHGPN